MSRLVFTRDNSPVDEQVGALGGHLRVNSQVLKITVCKKLGYLARDCAYPYLNAVPIPEQAHHVCCNLLVYLRRFRQRRRKEGLIYLDEFLEPADVIVRIAVGMRHLRVNLSDNRGTLVNNVRCEE